MVKDTNIGSGTSSVDKLTAVGNALYFMANDGANGYELWRSDGTANGTMMAKDINSGSSNSDPSELTAVGNSIYFYADNGQDGKELWAHLNL